MAVRTAQQGETFDTASPGDDLDSAQTTVDGSAVPDQIKQATHAWEDQLGWERTDFDTDMGVMQAVRMIGGGVIGIAVVVIVVNSVLTTNAVANSSGPFSGVIDSLETTGVSAMVLLVVGLLVAAASKLMTFFGGGF